MFADREPARRSRARPGRGSADRSDRRSDRRWGQGRPDRDLDAIRAAIERRFGLVPSFFMLAREQPEIVDQLFRLAAFAYLDSPLPSLFKERLFTYLSRFCVVPYCLARHCGFLLGRGPVAGDREAEGVAVGQALDMLRTPVPDATEAERILTHLRDSPGPLEEWPGPESPLEEGIFRGSTLVFLRPVQYPELLDELRRVLGPERYNHLMVFLAFIRFAHFWTEVHPELGLDPDLERLMDEQRALADWVGRYREEVQTELAQRINTELELLEALRERTRAVEEANRALRETVVERTRAAEAAEAASRAKSNFLAVMSHELRTPLNAILGYADLLQDEVGGRLSDTQRQQVARMRESGRHLGGLIEQILSLSRIESGREELERKRFDAAALVRETAGMIEPLTDRKELAFTVDAPDRPLEMDSDPGKLRQILPNLLSNAVEFTDEGKVEVRLREEFGDVIVEVEDTGVGIGPEDRDRVFHPFEQVEQGKTRARGGAGLGLSVSLGLARLLGGSLTLRSAMGRGSTFTVRVPRRAPDGAE